ncbi:MULTISPECIES: long-chain fatty acid--CoA ligase [unclassified Bradyrhizobium]|uniref:long-chain fatty acid--CoA ligase n=1 Tax=unclassified Bradyrhizobium TaxID=2631580 RepID=UPI001FFA2087|nr:MULTISPECIES: long-chain fatty acid--CoA ligase [unclassified Bradyrhizobium]MCK1319062.1 long-chain fatty acid--CoA ligase [Bradyrhizobium sp. 23]MCK1505116.1 long-chain fatty acid--CoA ligase [Bradyrhizobium sp. 18]
MLGLMMDTPLLTTDILRYAATAHGETEIVSRNVDGSIHRTCYSAAKQRCLRLSAALDTFGLSRGDRLGSLAWNTHHHFELFYGVTGEGLVLHTINPRLFEDTLVRIINHAEDQWIFIDAATLKLAEALAPHLTSVKGWLFMDASEELPDSSLANIISYEGLLKAQRDDHQWPSFDERSASIICYTSGTTGDPKGIVYSHRSIVLASLYMSTADMVGVFRPGELEAVMPIAPLFHANGWMMPFTAPMNGQKLVLPGRNFEPSMLCELIAAEGVTACAAVPTVWLGIVQYLKETGFKIPSLRAALVAGTKAPKPLVEDLESHGISVGQVWGMTEAAGGVRSTPAPGSSQQTREEQLERKLRQGRMGFGTELRIVGDDGVPLPHDGTTQGHLEARGPCIASGYYRHEETASTDWLSTGDVARIHRDGTIEIVDRSKDVIKSGGEWISSVTVESAAMEHPALALAAVVGVSHPRWQERPLLFATLKSGCSASREQLIEHLAARLPKWWLPDDVIFVTALPMTATGKIRKAELRDAISAGAYGALGLPEVAIGATGS